MSDGEKKDVKKNVWAERLRGRGRMAVASIGAMLVLGVMGVTQPLGGRIDSANEELAKAQARAQLAAEITDLRHQANLYQKRLPHGVDTNDWTNYLLNGIRAERVRLTRMEPKDPITMGPCKVLSWQVDMEGDLDSCARVLAWLEGGPRMMRIDRLQIDGGGSGQHLIMTMLLKGIALDDGSKEKLAKPGTAAAAAAAPAKRPEGARP